MTKRLISDEEVEYLAELYLKLQTNPVIQQMKKTFAVFVDEYVAREMKELDRVKRGVSR